MILIELMYLYIVFVYNTNMYTVVEYIALLTNLRFYNRSKSDEGQYTCRSVLNHSINATVMIIVDGMCLFN